MKKKIVIDILMFVLMLLEFSKAYMSPIWHELFGLLLVVLIIIHLILNKSYLKSINKGNYTIKRFIMLISNILFFLTFLLSVIFGILSSQELFKYFSIGTYGIQFLHKIFSYISLLLLGIHLGINFNSMFGKVRRKINNVVILYVIDILIIFYGLYSLIKLEILKHVIGKYGFGLVDGNIVINIFRYFSVIMMFSIVINYFYKKYKGKNK